MQGQITKFRGEIGIGVIAADDGRKYRFSKSAIMNANALLIGEDVDFQISAGRPAEIIVLAGSPWSAFGAPGTAH